MSKLENTDSESTLAIAQDELTAPETLTQLASDNDARIRQAVASNPNTPLEVLSKLGAEFPEVVIENPIFKISLLEAPNSLFVKLCLARSASTDEKMLAKLSCIDKEAIVLAVAGNPNTPLSILEGFVDEPPDFYNEENAEIEDLDPLLIAIANNPQVSESLLTKLADFGSYNVSLSVLQNPKTSIALLERHANYKNSEIHLAIALNPATPDFILEKIANDPSTELREVIKRHPNASEKVVRMAIRRRGNTYCN